MRSLSLCTMCKVKPHPSIDNPRGRVRNTLGTRTTHTGSEERAALIRDSRRRPPQASRSLPLVLISPNHHSQLHKQLLIVRIHTRPPHLQRRHDMKLGGLVLTFQMGSDIQSILMLLVYRILDPVPLAFLSRRHLQRPTQSGPGIFTPLIVVYLQAPWFQGRVPFLPLRDKRN